jgi:hypothetical protein
MQNSALSRGKQRRRGALARLGRIARGIEPCRAAFSLTFRRPCPYKAARDFGFAPTSCRAIGDLLAFGDGSPLARKRKNEARILLYSDRVLAFVDAPR